MAVAVALLMLAVTAVDREKEWVWVWAWECVVLEYVRVSLLSVRNRNNIAGLSLVGEDDSGADDAMKK